MDNQWKEEICGTCDFAIGGVCRKHPPNNVKIESEIHCPYTEVIHTLINYDTLACSCWREKV